MPIATVNDINLYYEVYGKGEPIVLIGGLANDLTDYTRTSIVSTLAQKYQVIVFDNRGVGRSDKPDVPYSISMMADDTAELLKKLDIKEANIIGVSMGGRIALDLALRYPRFVKKLILVSTAARIIKSLRRIILFGVLSKIFGFAVFKTKYPQPGYAFKRQEKASSSYNCVARLPEITAPTIILQGKKDSLIPIKLAEELHQGIKNSKLLLFDGGHAFLFFKSKEFTDAVFEFLKNEE